jgi:hypothetical protein
MWGWDQRLGKPGWGVPQAKINKKVYFVKY